MVAEKSPQRGRRTKQRGNGMGSVTRDNSKNLWYAKITAGYDDAGKPIRKSSRGFKIKGDAERELRTMLDARDQGIGVNQRAVTVGTYLDDWLERIKTRDLQPKTIEQYTYCVSHVTPQLRKMQLDKLTPTDADRFFTMLKTTGGKRGTGLSEKTVKHIRTTLGVAFQDAVKKETIRRNPIALADAISVKSKEIKPFSEDEANQILDAAEGLRLEALYNVAIYLGLRQGEILGLRWQDIELDQALLHVRQQTQQQATGAPIIKSILKTTRSRRSLKLNTHLVTVLREHKDRQRFEREKHGEGWNPNDLVFPSEAGTPMFARNLISHYTKLLKRAGLEHRNFHQLRHTAATMMIARKLPLIDVSRILGHEKIATTADVYVHWLPQESAGLATAFDDFRQKKQS